MTNVALLTSLFFSVVTTYADAATSVAVLELGTYGSVHPSNSKRKLTTVQGISAFWGDLHGNRRNVQHSGLSVVPDLFKRPDNGIVIAVGGNDIDLDEMPFLSDLVSGDSASVVGVMDVTGSHAKDLMTGLNNYETIFPSSISETCKKHLVQSELSGFAVESKDFSSKEIDSKLESALKEIEASAKSQDANVVVHIVVDYVESESRRKLSRRLEDNAANQNAAAAGDGSSSNKDYSGYYGYGYYNTFGEWVTPFKTMFQIQYFNVVLWTSLGLVVALFFTIGLMVYMPLEADTLLFGESAKFVGDE